MDFKALAQDINVAGYTIFTGHLPILDVVDLLNASDVLVMPKIDHPLNHVASPIKIAEYLAAGRPIVSSRICELDKHLIHMEHVIFCEPGNIKELADAVNLALGDETLRTKLSSNASAIAKSLFDYRRVAGMIYEHAYLPRE
ncbi:MAG: glycosyltransferase family 4 protein [Chloroflexi bacterium]|nr:glycosyltransferase family 4 protein [Chloroflexota bacterium]